MRIGALKETTPGERRVALAPESCKKLIQAGYEVAIESGAGDAAGFPDAAYTEVGATWTRTRRHSQARAISCSR
jgi:NAD(P) transhydrogenase subunit alpha